MPVITALEVQKRNKERVNVYLDDEYAFALPLLEAARLQRGQCLSADDIAALSDEAAVQGAFDRAVYFLSFRPRSIEEVRRHLIKKDIPESVTVLAIERLCGQGYLDDGAFVRFWIENRDRFNPMSVRALRYELHQKGVDAALADGLLAELDAVDSAYRAAGRQMWRYKGKTRQEFERKVSQMLYRRGFDADVIRRAVQRRQAELEESDPDYFTDERAG